MKNVLSKSACEYMKSQGAPIAARKAIRLMNRQSGRGTAGIVTTDRKGRVGFAFNTEAMGRAWCDSEGRTRVQI